VKLTAYDTVKSLLAKRGPMQLDELTAALGMLYVTTRLAVSRLREEGEVVSEFHDRKTFYRLLSPDERELRAYLKRFPLGEVWKGVFSAAGTRPALTRRAGSSLSPGQGLTSTGKHSKGLR
jgi:hypothetical protein